MIARRRFLIGLATISGVAGVFGWGIRRATREQAIIAIVHKRLGYLMLDDAGVQRFAHDFVANVEISSGKLRLIAAFAPLYSRLSTSPGHWIADATRFGEERVCARYLLSSDFFRNGEDETRLVQYSGYFDPLRPCGNPFARPVLQSGSAEEPT